MHYIDMIAPNSPPPLVERFPILQEGLYVNHATLSPWPLETMLAVREYAGQIHRRGPLEYRRWLAASDRLREAAARLLVAERADEISLLANTSDGINTLALGMDWRAGDNLVAVSADFPSNVLPWRALQQRGVELRTADVRRSPDPEAALLDLVDRRTRVLAVSSVDWIDGFRLDIAKLGAACRNAGVVFFVDAIQHIGALRIDVQAAYIDVLAAGTHKWLLGPEGMGLFYCREAIRRRLQPMRLGWHMLEDRFDFERPDRPPADHGRKFEAGTPSRLGQVALLASLQVLLEHGVDRVESGVLANTEALMGGLGLIDGIRLISDTQPDRRSGIVSFALTRVDPGAVMAGLARHRVFAVRRGAGIRLSPHFYQGKAEMQELLDKIEAAVAQAKNK